MAQPTQPPTPGESAHSFAEIDAQTRWRLRMGREPQTRREAEAALGEVRRVRAQPWWRSDAAVHAAPWAVVWPAVNVWIVGDPFSLEMVLTGVTIALVVFVFAFWLNGRRADRMERKAQAALSRFGNLDADRHGAGREN